MGARVEMLAQRLEAAQAFLRQAVKILREVDRDLVRLRAFQPSAEPVAQPQELDALEARLTGILEQVREMHRLAQSD